jgi:hypothetical protein
MPDMRDTEFVHLTLDHINGGGTKHRRENNKANCAIYRLLAHQGYPDGYRILCHNCNYLSYAIGVDAKHEAMARHRLKLKLEALCAYSDGLSKCHQCDVDDYRVLTIDHVYGGGRAELRALGIKGGADYYRYLRQHNYPNKESLQVLCFNHNCGKRMISASNEFIIATVEQWKIGASAAYRSAEVTNGTGD